MKNKLLKGMLLLASCAFGAGVSAQSYCLPTYNYSSERLSQIETVGAVSNVNYTSSAYPAGGFSDETAQVVQAYETLTFDLNTVYSPSYGHIVRVWVDWNNDMTFDHATEMVSEISGNGGLLTQQLTIPVGVAVGTYRVRVRGVYGSTADPLPCSSESWGSAADFTLEIINSPSCLPPQNLNVSNVTSTTLDLAWTEVNSATEWQIEYGPHGYTQGSASGTVIPTTSSNPHNISITAGTEYDFYVRSICAVGDTSVWSSPFEMNYCDVSSQYTSEYLSNISSVGALVDVNYTSSSFPAGSYDDATALIFETFEAQTFDINTTYSAGSNGVNVWVDWNKDMVFDASELVGSAAGSTASNTISVTVPGGTPQDDYRVRVRGQWGSGANPPACGQITWGSTVDLTLTVVQPPSCLPPNGVQASNVTDTSVTFAWTENGTATTWNIEYGPTGFTPGTGAGTEINGVTANPYNITGLMSSTEYDFYVQADCGGGDLSFWSPVLGPVLTNCSISEANGFCEGFDINLSPSIGCWRVMDENSDGDMWTVGTTQPNQGAYAAEFYSDFNNGNNDDYLVSPQLNLTGIEAMKFAYSVYSASEPNDFQVLLSTTGTDVSDFTDTLMHLAQYSNTDYLDTVIDLTSFTGPVYVAFHIPPGGLDGWRLFIDDLCFGECVPTPGQDGSFDACMLDGQIDLSNNIISNINTNGRWEFPANQSLIVDDTLFNIGSLPSGGIEVLYIVEGLCVPDTTIATINVYQPSSAGEDGSMTVCMNTPSNLFSALSGNVDMGGTWYDPQNNPLSNSQPIAPNVPGSYQYTYIVDNGFCPSDTSVVVLTSDGSCDFLSVGTEELNDISVYPNPATDVISIDNPSSTSVLKVEMLDMNGRIVLVENKGLNNSKKTTLNIQAIEKGVYTLRIYNDNGQRTFKIVKQ
ncbi:GEVED domain-containing protein [Brumimicrobium aurantiacum]|uniref:T9SS C-terminal target domain-containing protein n=1 Tax=Brumimicrobium aurantiacum TaxID=1737063 RepID=A0A3E1F0W0_9FLAO|nr:GEVED domain-containing protein [Brumimicrobium aurantiacum]RFC55462.1 T9SS C-terminal target domain-containing protein [Brumimicrobium aurantiacum]